jgi:hypothetical protein
MVQTVWRSRRIARDGQAYGDLELCYLRACVVGEEGREFLGKATLSLF